MTGQERKPVAGLSAWFVREDQGLSGVAGDGVF